MAREPDDGFIQVSLRGTEKAGEWIWAGQWNTSGTKTMGTAFHSVFIQQSKNPRIEPQKLYNENYFAPIVQ